MNSKEQKLDALLAHVQKEVSREEFIYGVTNHAGRGFFRKIGDFYIDHSRIPMREKAYFFELLATMLRAGIGLSRGLKILIFKTENAHLSRIIATISYELEHGRLLSQALDRFPDIFTEAERGAVRSAESVGHLEDMLFKIARTLMQQTHVNMRLTSALAYPIAVVIALFTGIVVMLLFVVPRIKNLFSESGIVLPLPTRLMLGLSTFLTEYWWVLFIAIIFTIIALHVHINSENGRFSWDFKKLRIPLIGVILRKIYIMRFVETLGLLVESGLPITKALEFTAQSVGNEIYRHKIYEVLGRVQEGQKIAATCAESPFLFPETVTNMLAVGEYSASLGDISKKIGSYFKREIDYTLRTISHVIGPLFILVIGLLVAFFALAVLSPIFSLAQVVG